MNELELKKTSLLNDAKALNEKAKAGGFTPEDQTKFDGLVNEIKLVDKQIENDKSLSNMLAEQVQQTQLSNVRDSRPQTMVASHETQGKYSKGDLKDMSRFNLDNFFQGVINERFEGAEKDFVVQDTEGFICPSDIINMKRARLYNTAVSTKGSSAGNFGDNVQTYLDTYRDAFYQSPILESLGVRYVNLPDGIMDVPIWNRPSTKPGFKPELDGNNNAALAATVEGYFSKKSLTTHRLTSKAGWTGTISAQTGDRAGMKLMESLARETRLQMSHFFIYGSGTGNEVRGVNHIVTTSGGLKDLTPSTVPDAGVVLTRKLLLELAGSPDNEDAGEVNRKFIFNTRTRTLLRNELVEGATAGNKNTSAVFIMTDTDRRDNTLLGEDAIVSNLITSDENAGTAAGDGQNLTSVFYGAWENAEIYTWGAGPRFIVDPYTNSGKDITTIASHNYWDTLFVHNNAFAKINKVITTGSTIKA